MSLATLFFLGNAYLVSAYTDVQAYDWIFAFVVFMLLANIRLFHSKADMLPYGHAIWSHASCYRVEEEIKFVFDDIWQ